MPFLSVFHFVLIYLFIALELDQENLNSSAKQKWKPSASKQQCREAYRFVYTFNQSNIDLRYIFFVSRRAMSEIIQSDDGETSVDNDHR